MSYLAHFMGREQQAKADFVGAMAQMRPYPSSPKEGPPAFDAMTETALHFGISELRTRQADRLSTLGIDEEQAVALRESARVENDRGLISLAAVRPFADALTAQEIDEQELAAWRERSPQLRADWRDSIKNLELDPEVVGQLATQMDRVCDAVDEEGRPGLGRHIAGLIDELESLRRPEPANIRPTDRPRAVPAAVIAAKIAVIAIIMGITAGAIWYLISTGAPWYDLFASQPYRVSSSRLAASRSWGLEVVTL
jgi:hypothetical protein